jgi:hypothetical protein
MLSGAGWAAELKMPRWRSDGFGDGRGMGTAPEDGGPGGRVVGRGRSFGAVTGLVVKDADFRLSGAQRGRDQPLCPSSLGPSNQFAFFC